MVKIHSKTVHPQPFSAEDLEHELPAGETDGIEAPAGNGSVAPPPAAAAETETQKLQAERDALIDRLARLQAEFENYRKRNAREQQEFRDYALAGALTTLIPVLDSLDLALKNINTKDKDADSELRSGLELVRKQFADALAKLGVTPVAAEGTAFDPQWHQAVEVVESDQVADHHVLEELQRGYRLKERLLRPAMVRVASRPKK
jgi:molecular chaperone GrpE